MARSGSSSALSGIHAGDGWRLFRNLLGGLVILVVWLSLWTWVAVGVVRPLSAVTAAPLRPAAESHQRIQASVLVAGEERPGTYRFRAQYPRRASR